MNKTLSTSKLIDILPENLRYDPDIIAAAMATDGEFQRLVSKINNCFVIVGIDNVDEQVLDVLGVEMQIDAYDTALPVGVKRNLVKEGYLLHYTKGTPYAVENLITTLFDEGKVVEWFEYGGEPYHFKVVTSNREVTQERAVEFTRALASVTRKSTRLELVEITQAEEMNLYFAGVLYIGDKLTIRQVV